MSEADAVELYRKYRPAKFSEVIGQREAVDTLREMGKSGKVPHVILFHGPSGTGKTTLARILRTALQCSDIDFVELNAASARGIDTIRDISKTMSASPLRGPCRVFMIDECQALTTDAQNSFLKPLEDTPKHVYFMLCTTDPQKLKGTIKTRVTEIACNPLTVADLKTVVKSVLEKEKATLQDDVIAKIAEASEGSARKALVILHAVIGLKDHDEQLKAIVTSTDETSNGYLLARALFGKASGGEVAEILRKLQEAGEDAETARWTVLGYARSVLLKSSLKNDHAAKVINEFRDNFYDSKHAGLAIACYECVGG
jgi:DNA polymerase-3 subunit gamma/tau